MKKILERTLNAIGLGVNAVAPNATAFCNLIIAKNIFGNDAKVSVVTEDYGKSFIISVTIDDDAILIQYTLSNCRVTSVEIEEN
jgi:hypothetical protein